MNFETAERELIARNVASPAECLEKLVHARILSVDYRGGVSRVELTHDLLTPFAVHYRKLRREEEAISMQQARLAARRYARLKRVTVGVVIGGLVIASSLAAYAWHQRNQISQLFEKVSGEERKKTELLVREAKAYSTIGYRNWQEWLSDSRPMPGQPNRANRNGTRHWPIGLTRSSLIQTKVRFAMQFYRKRPAVRGSGCQRRRSLVKSTMPGQAKAGIS